MMLSAKQLASSIGLSERRVYELAQTGQIPGHNVDVDNANARKSQIRFVLDEVLSVLPPRREDRRIATQLRCRVCKRDLPRDSFNTITVRDKRCADGHEWTGPAHDCRDCQKQQKRESRRKKAEGQGKSFAPRGERATWEAQTRERREQRRAEGLKRLAEHHAKQRAEAIKRREELAVTTVLTCQTCKRTLPRNAFHASDARRCKACTSKRDRAKFERARDQLSDSYVKRQLTKYSGLTADLIPPAMIEAKRLQLMLERRMPIESERYAIWLSSALKDGPIDAELLNKEALSAGFARSRLRSDKQFRLARRAVATYDEQNNTWRKKTDR